jgi:hypothetical protein
MPAKTFTSEQIVAMLRQIEGRPGEDGTWCANLHQDAGGAGDFTQPWSIRLTQRLAA